MGYYSNNGLCLSYNHQSLARSKLFGINQQLYRGAGDLLVGLPLRNLVWVRRMLW